MAIPSPLRYPGGSPVPIPSSFADTLPPEALARAANAVPQLHPELAKLAEILASMPSGQQIAQGRMATGDAQGIPIPEPQVVADPELDRILQSRLAFENAGLQAGGRSFGPNLGIMGGGGAENSPSSQPPPVNMQAYLAEKGYRPSTFAPGIPGIGVNGQFMEIPSENKPGRTSAQVIEKVNKEHPYAGPPRQTNQAVLNRAQSKGSAMQARLQGGLLPQLLAQADDNTRQGDIARSTIDPRGSALAAQLKMFEQKAKSDQERLNSPLALLSAIGGARGDGANPALDKIIADLAKQQLAKVAGGGQVPGDARIQGFPTTTTVDPIADANADIEHTPGEIDTFLDRIPAAVRMDPQMLRDELVRQFGPSAVAKWLETKSQSPVVGFFGDQYDLNQAPNERRAKVGLPPLPPAGEPISIYGHRPGQVPPVYFHP